MMETRFWLIRHAIVAKNELDRVYGNKDVPICLENLASQRAVYEALAARLPRPATWFATPLSRTQCTAAAIFDAGYPAQDLTIEPGMAEQHLGVLQGVLRDEVSGKLLQPAPPFWPIAADEVPEGGESVVQMMARVGEAMERLAQAHPGQDVVIVSHGGPIRCAVGHAMGVGAVPVLHLSVQNLSLTRIDHLAAGWRVGWLNAMAGTNVGSTAV